MKRFVEQSLADRTVEELPTVFEGVFAVVRHDDGAAVGLVVAVYAVDEVGRSGGRARGGASPMRSRVNRGCTATAWPCRR